LKVSHSSGSSTQKRPLKNEDAAWCKTKQTGRTKGCRPFGPNVPEANGKSTRCVLSGALLLECFGVAPTLVQHQVRDLALFVLEELNFCVHNLGKHIVSDSAKIGTLGCPVICVISWSPSKVTAKTKPCPNS